MRKYRNATGERAFDRVAMYALSCLTLPISNAVVERMFSTVTLTKTEIKNRMKFQMLDALLRIKMNLGFEKICCKGFIVTRKMLDLFNKQQMYDNANTGEENASEDLELSCMDDS